jgi:hypothetical protein
MFIDETGSAKNGAKPTAASRPSKESTVPGRILGR